MTELNLWGSFLDRNDVQGLSIEHRMMLISLAATVADSEPDIEGFLPRSGVRSIPWHDPMNAESILDAMAKEGHFLTAVDDPEGWVINGWSSRTVRFRPGNSECDLPAWGQTPRDKLLEQREKTRLRQERQRQRRAELMTK